MSRFHYFVRNPKRALSALATLMLAAGVVVGSGAYFQSTDSNNNNSVATGGIDLQAFSRASDAVIDARTCSPRESTLPGIPTAGPFHQNSVDPSFDNPCKPDSAVGSANQLTDPDAAVLQVSNLEPGQTVRGRIKLANAGSLDAVQYMKVIKESGPNSLFNALYLRVYKRPSVGDGEGGNEIFRGQLNAADDAWTDATGKGVAETTVDTIGQGEEEVYDFYLKLPETGLPQNLEDLSIALRVDWLGRDQGAPTP